MIWTIIHAIDLILWFICAFSVVYVAFFAIAGFFLRLKKRKEKKVEQEQQYSYLVLYPAYKEDAVICLSAERFIKQSYPRSKYKLCVIADEMKPDTVEKLKGLADNVIVPNFEGQSSKAKSLKLAMKEVNGTFDRVVILDADNVVREDFLEQLNTVCNQGYDAVQCHRCAKNSENDIAMLDGASEEINNHVFRRSHNLVGLSSALIGSGMCFPYQWFKENVEHLSTAGEDRELEELLLSQKIHIHFAEHIPVFDEKVSSADNFQRQRLRWMTAQVQSLIRMTRHLPTAIKQGNIDYIDKTLQQALIPRSMLLVILPVLGLFLTFVLGAWGVKWLVLFLLFCLSLVISLPPQMFSRGTFASLMKLPQLVWRMLKNVLHINHKNTDFIHTEHKGENNE